MNATFWHNKRVLLTGHTGFKGSWLSLWLQQLGAKLTGIALPAPTQPSLFEAANVATGMDSRYIDIRDQATVLAVMQEIQPEIVIHMAAQPLVRYAYQNPVETYASNVMGTVHILDAVRLVGSTKACVVITTDKCYENKEWLWGYRENDRLGGFDPYSNSKACAELVCDAYRNSYFSQQQSTALATVRAGNVIGGGDWAEDRLMTDIIDSLSNNRLLTLRNPLATRPWQHVLEPLRGYLMIAEKLFEQGHDFAQAWNFGPYDDDVKTVGWITEQMIQRWGRGAWQQDPSAQPHEAQSLKLDSSKSRQQLNWHPKLRLDEGLNWIIAWYQAYQTGQNMRTFTESQILAYRKVACPD